MTLVSQREDSLSQELRYNYAVISEQDPVRRKIRFDADRKGQGLYSRCLTGGT